MVKAVQQRGAQRSLHAIAWGSALSTLVLGLVACSGESSQKQASQTAATVNGEDVTVHQINHVLEQQRGLRPDQADAAGRQVLERLIDQTLAVQKARELELDRDPKVVLSMEVAKREILARAYAERLGRGVIKPSSEEVRKYHDAHPELFAQRKIFTLDEFNVQVPIDKVHEVEALMEGSANAADFASKLKVQGAAFSGKQSVRPAEQLPVAMLQPLAELRPGKGMLTAVAGGARVVFVTAASVQPVDAKAAAPAIEAFLLEERRREAIGRGARDMRDAAKIEYVGRFAEKREATITQPASATASEPSTATPN